MPVAWSDLTTPFDDWSPVDAVIQIGPRIVIAPTSSLLGGETIYTSDDGGATWDYRVSPFDGGATPNQFAYSLALDRLVCVSAELICYSDDQGDTWTSVGDQGVVHCVAVDDSEGLFVAGLASETNNILTSPDGIVWTPRSTPWNGSGGVVHGVCYAAGSINEWVAVGHGDTNKSAMSAPDPTSTWTSVASGPFDSGTALRGGNSVAFDGTVLVATANYDSATTAVSVSSDGATWAGQTTDLDGAAAVGLAASSDLILAGGPAGIVESDDNGTTWTAASGPLSGLTGCLTISIGDDYSIAGGVNDAGDVTAATSAEPTAPTFSSAPVFLVAFDDPTLEADPTWTQLG